MESTGVTQAGEGEGPPDSCHCRDQSSEDRGRGSLQGRGERETVYKSVAAQVCEPFPNPLGLFTDVQDTQTHFRDNPSPAELIKTLSDTETGVRERPGL